LVHSSQQLFYISVFFFFFWEHFSSKVNCLISTEDFSLIFKFDRLIWAFCVCVCGLGLLSSLFSAKLFSFKFHSNNRLQICLLITYLSVTVRCLIICLLDKCKPEFAVTTLQVSLFRLEHIQSTCLLTAGFRVLHCYVTDSTAEGTSSLTSCLLNTTFSHFSLLYIPRSHSCKTLFIRGLLIHLVLLNCLSLKSFFFNFL
jgi:hypothetical protein